MSLNFHDDMKCRILLFFLLISSQFCCTPKSKEQRSSLKNRLERILNEHTLELWYPKVIDRINGGYYSDYSFDWTKQGLQNKFIVTQARHVWTLSKAIEFYPERVQYQEYAKHGYEFLRDFMWDKTHGGFYQMVDSVGIRPTNTSESEQRTYGNAFAIYALAAYYKVSKNPEVLMLAKDAFSWLDANAHDKEHGGYFKFMRSGKNANVQPSANNGGDTSDDIVYGIKDYNSSIHLLEAFTELYAVWPDELVKSRLQEMFEVVSQTMMDDRGFLKLYFHADWTPFDDHVIIEIGGNKSNYFSHVTFGHDVETGFLLLEAAEVLGIEKEVILPKAKRLVDHALQKGWDNEKGGFYEQGKYIEGGVKIIDSSKIWWTQTEGMNSLLLMHSLFSNDALRYFEKFELQVDYIEKNLLDYDYLGWYSFGIDHHPEMKKRPKASIWKGTYHTSRSLMHCVSILESKGY